MLGSVAHIYNYAVWIQKNSRLMWKGVGVTKVYQVGWYSDKGEKRVCTHKGMVGRAAWHLVA